MKILNNYVVTGALFSSGTGPEAIVGDQVKLYLDTDANEEFPEYIVGVIQHPIAKVNCKQSTSYRIEYDEDDLDGAANLLHPDDIIDATIITQADTIAVALEAEIARALAAEALLAPKASPTFTGTVTLPSTTSIGTVSSVEIGYLDGVTGLIQTQLDLLAPKASPTFTGNPLAPTPAVGDNDTSIATTAFVEANKNRFLNATQALYQKLTVSGALGSEILTIENY